MPFRQFAILVIVLVCAIAAIICGIELTGTVSSGTYVIKQAAVSGNLTAIMQPGMFAKNFGDITVWPVAETFYFTADKEGATSPADAAEDQSVEVRFNDGGVCHVSGTCRLDMPRTPDEALALVTKLGYRTASDQVEREQILPTIRRALIMTANLTCPRRIPTQIAEQTSFNFSWDQIANGIYKTQDETVTDADPITGAQVTHVRKTIMRDAHGIILREQNPLEGTGVTLSIFEIKDFAYEDKGLRHRSRRSRMPSWLCRPPGRMLRRRFRML